jgi:hypothetical protein
LDNLQRTNVLSRNKQQFTKEATDNAVAITVQ